MTSTRILSAAIFGVIYLTAMYWSPLGWVTPLAPAAAAALGAYEFCAMARTRGHQPILALAVVASVAVTLSGVGPVVGARDLHAHTMMIVLAATFLASGTDLVWRNRTDNAISDAATTLFAGFYVSAPLGLLMALYYTLMRASGLIGANYLLVFIVTVTWMGDSGAYFIGRWRGRTRLCEHLSPSKTVEGLYGGFVTSAIWAMLIKALPLPGSGLITWIDAGMLTLLVCLFGPIGDLTASVMKRDARVKDSGWDFTGHGGILDVVDSLLFTAPAAYIYFLITNPDLFSG